MDLNTWERVPFDVLAGVQSDVIGVELAAWMAVIAERFDEAVALAGSACAAGLGAATVRPAALRMTVRAFAGLDGFDDDLLTRLARACLDAGADRMVPDPRLEVANWFTFADRFDDAGRLVELQMRAAVRAGDVIGVVWSRCCSAELNWRRGRWGRMRAALADVMAHDADTTGPGGYAEVLAARLAASTGDAAGMAAHVGRARGVALDRGDRSTLWRADAVEAFHALGTGAWEHAVDLLAPLLGSRVVAGPALASVRLWDADLIEAAVAGGDVSLARAALDRLGSEHRSGWAFAAAARGEALLGGPPAWVDAVRSAALFAEIGAPFERARSELVAGELASAAGERREGRALLHRARSVFDALGAADWSARVTRALAPQPAADSLPLQPMGCGRHADLTEQERTVLGAAATGASNKEIASLLSMSVKTVETHLTRIYRKTGVRSRAQLIAQLHGAIG